VAFLVHGQTDPSGLPCRCATANVPVAEGRNPSVKVCSKPGCPHLQPCPTHMAEDRARRNARVRDYGYGSSNWQQVRKQRHALAQGRCELKLDGCTITATHTHLNPELQGDHRTATIYHARACCASCSGAIDAPRARTAA
jgi:hypothetical protein